MILEFVMIEIGNKIGNFFMLWSRNNILAFWEACIVDQDFTIYFLRNKEKSYKIENFHAQQIGNAKKYFL